MNGRTTAGSNFRLGGSWMRTGPSLGPKSGNFAQKALQRLVDIAKPTFMGDRLRHLHGEAEVIGDIIGPALIGRQAMRSIEGGVDLDAVKPARVSHQMAAVGREGILVLLWDRPSGGPNIDATLTSYSTYSGQRAARG